MLSSWLILSCIDGGLICVPVAIIIACGGGGLVTWFYKKFRRVCKTSCHCNCHPVESKSDEQPLSKTETPRS